jgi:hypothetical protein
VGARLTRIGVEGVPVGGQAREVLEAHGLDAASLVRKLEALVDGGGRPQQPIGTTTS